MKATARTGEARSALEVIEQAIHLLRTCPPAAWASYCAGTLPFVLGLLYFWTEMSRSPFAAEDLPAAALGLGMLFIWMKFWQALFARRLRGSLSGGPISLRLGDCWRVLLVQGAVQPFGLFLIPLSALPVVPFGWVFAFFQNVTALGETSGASGPSETLRQAARQSRLHPRQNLGVLGILAGFSLLVFINWASVCYLLPRLIKLLFGIESVFTRGWLSMLNTTFLVVILGLTYLSIDPITKAVYVLRCFYGQSVQSGEDLKAELRSFMATAVTVCLLLVACATASGQERLWATAGPVPASASGAQGQPVSVVAPSADTSSALDQAIQEVMRQRKYTWRAPREKIVEPKDAEKNFVQRALEWIYGILKEWGKAVLKWLEHWLRKLLPRSIPFTPTGSGWNWILCLEVLLFLLLAGAVGGLLFLLFRLVQDRQGRRSTIAAEAMPAEPDPADENLGADQLPEQGWMRLARELLGKGELRLALRAFYFASLASLAEHDLLRLARFKSNRDYEREVRRRGHALPELAAAFSENVGVFDRTWYGMHALDSGMVDRFASNVERIKVGANGRAQ